MRFLKILGHNVNTLCGSAYNLYCFSRLVDKTKIQKLVQVAGGDANANIHLLQLLAMPTDGCNALPASSVSMSLHCNPFAKYLNMQHT
jgi:hypothetical protein